MPFDVTPTAMHRGGDAVARVDGGRVVFVRGGLPDERVSVELVDESPTYAVAEVVEVLDPSAARVTPPCPEVARGCGGCSWQHMAPRVQREVKTALVADALARSGQADVAVAPTVELASSAFRTTLRMAVVDGRAAYRAARSHDAIAVDGCYVAHPLLDELVRDGRFGAATEVVLRCGARTGERLASATPRGVEIDVPEGVDPRRFHEEAAGRRWRVSAPSFFQTRPDGIDALAALVTDAAAGLDQPGRALDLFSGVGLFAGVLADAGWQVTAVEGARSSVADARVNLRGLDVAIVSADVNRWTPSPAEFVVADPSRVGLGPRGARAVIGSGARRVVLISCDLAALGRDTTRLVAAGYSLTAVTPVDLFPHTPHVEVVSVFDR